MTHFEQPNLSHEHNKSYRSEIFVSSGRQFLRVHCHKGTRLASVVSADTSCYRQLQCCGYDSKHTSFLSNEKTTLPVMIIRVSTRGCSLPLWHTRLHAVTSKKTVIFIVTVVRTLNLAIPHLLWNQKIHSRTNISFPLARVMHQHPPHPISLRYILIICSHIRLGLLSCLYPSSLST